MSDIVCPALTWTDAARRAACCPVARPKKSDRLTVRIEPDLRARLRAAADRRDRSESWLAVELIRQGLDRDEARGRVRRRA